METIDPSSVHTRPSGPNETSSPGLKSLVHRKWSSLRNINLIAWIQVHVPIVVVVGNSFWKAIRWNCRMRTKSSKNSQVFVTSTEVLDTFVIVAAHKQVCANPNWESAPNRDENKNIWNHHLEFFRNWTERGHLDPFNSFCWGVGELLPTVTQAA